MIKIPDKMGFRSEDSVIRRSLGNTLDDPPDPQSYMLSEPYRAVIVNTDGAQDPVSLR